MLFLMEWQIKDGCVEKAVHKFLSTGAPLPVGSSLVGRFHAPGSVRGWLIVDAEDVTTVYYHASEWGELLKWDVHPVYTDTEAGLCCHAIWGNNEGYEAVGVESSGQDSNIHVPLTEEDDMVNVEETISDMDLHAQVTMAHV